MARPPNPVAASAPYHHGDLRRALLETAGTILSETGRWDFSLREVARRAGVSHAASYRHFANKEALIAALAGMGYEMLQAQMTAAARGVAEPLGALRAIAQAYVRFGVANPALYRLMFGQALPSLEGLPPAVANVLAATRAVLRNVILAGARTAVLDIDPDDAQDVSVAVVAAWSLVHGFTLLTIDRAVEREIEPGMIDAIGARVVERLITGLVPA